MVYDVQLHFTQPWLWLLMIPAVLLALIPYFRLNKKYRKTRNRITSMVLHLIVMFLAITMLAGTTVHYRVTNDDNEIIILVDLSDTEEQAATARNSVVNRIIEDSEFGGFKVGVVTFGFTQVYASPLSYELDEVYANYLAAPRPDCSATDIASALLYTKSLFEHPETSKIVLVTDGKETDNIANDAVRSVIAQGTNIDVAYVPSSFSGDETQILGIEMPSYHVNLNEECEINVIVQSDVKASIDVDLEFDNGSIIDEVSQPAVVNANKQIISIKHTFTEEGLYEIRASISVNNDPDDNLSHNNVYSIYYNLEVYNRILMVERVIGESEAMTQMINENGDYDIDTVVVGSGDLPTTIEDLLVYDQIILNNISYGDLKTYYGEEYDDMLKEYVEDYGGGLFTVGGNEDDGETAHAYNRSDLNGTALQEILPVQAINYTPPVGVMIIIDRSGSMNGTDEYGQSKLEWAKQGAAVCLNALSERDYVGLMTLDDETDYVLPMTPRTQEATILAAITTIEDTGGGTEFAPAVDRAASALRSLRNVDKRHIILVTDGMPFDLEETVAYATEYYESSSITISVVGIGVSPDSSAAENMKKITEAAHGRLHAVRADQLVSQMREDLNVPEIKEVNYTPFNPHVANALSPVLKGVEMGDGEEVAFTDINASLDGFYGVKVRPQADLILTGDFNVPVYAQWKYGKGTVGSFMCDLQGVWSEDFMSSSSGKTFIKNVINNLMPTTNIRPNPLNVELDEDNYTNKMSIYENLKNGEYVKAKIYSVEQGEDSAVSLNEVTVAKEGESLNDLGVYVVNPLSASNSYSRCNFVVKKTGVYVIALEKCDKDGNTLEMQEIYKSFAFSEEYDIFSQMEESQIIENLTELAARGNGSVIVDHTDPVEVFENFVTSIEKVYDPRTLFAILAIILFLLDIAVRKFKFKWPHELIREYKAKNKK